MTSNHYKLVIDLLDMQPGTTAHDDLLRLLKSMWRIHPELEREYIDIMADHTPQIGEVPPAERVPAGILLT